MYFCRIDKLSIIGVIDRKQVDYAGSPWTGTGVEREGYSPQSSRDFTPMHEGEGELSLKKASKRTTEWQKNDGMRQKCSTTGYSPYVST